MLTCGSCGAESPAGRAFCANCGSALARPCPTCSTANEASNKFCFNCGTALFDPDTQDPVSTSEPTSDPGERRLVSVLFGDLVGFTTFSEGRDPEDIRNMLTRFYERCREIIGRYGGTTDKFIGDAVMGVWGAVGAHEDDAERATRAALELVDMAAGLGEELGTPELVARAGVLSGEASVGSGGNEHGLVVGDLVNTASRLQSIAPPGGVYVGANTRDLVGSAIEFRSVGDERVKGKALPVAVFEATRVLALSTARTGGQVLEGPFVGRADELRLLKDQLHATGREGRARMISIVGEAGIGKSRLAAELIRYVDGITEGIYYHRGRSPSYGDGVTFWALGEMIRQRAGITEAEDSLQARAKLETMVAEFVSSDEDRRWIEPRLASIIGLAPSPPGERSEQFAALRAFFRGIAARGTVLMVFEDLHWADEGMLDFIEELVERTTSDPILVLCLARPELLDGRPDWGSSQKRTMSMHLSRLDKPSIVQLIAGLAPGLGEPMIDRIAERTAGVPLHAVEFVRMLLNTGQLVRDGDEFVLTGDDEELPVPDSVNAIIGARIDRLEPVAQSIIRDASVLGLTFTATALAELGARSPTEVEESLRSLVRQEVLEFDENPRSPERGQYRFVQGLIREVAYGRLTRAERVSRHLAVAEMFESTGDPELAGVVAGHYENAVGIDPGNEDLVAKACRAVIEAAGRAADLKSDAQAASLYERAAEMTTDVREKNSLRLSAAERLGRTGREDKGAHLAREVLDWARSQDDTTMETRAATVLADILSSSFDAAEAAELTIEVYRRVAPSSDPEWIGLAQATSRSLMLADRGDEAIAVADAVLPVMESLELIDEMLDTLITKGSALGFKGQFVEASTILRGVVVMAGDRDLHYHKMRALNNLITVSSHDVHWDLTGYLEFDDLVERLGEETWVVRSHMYGAGYLMSFGEIDAAMNRVATAEEFDLSEFRSDMFVMARANAELVRDGYDEVRFTRVNDVRAKYRMSDDPQLQHDLRSGEAETLLAVGRLEEALSVARDLEALSHKYPLAGEIGVFAAAQLRDEQALESVIATLEKSHPRGRASRGVALLGESYLAALRSDTEKAERAFAEAEDLWTKTNAPVKVAYARGVLAIVLGPDHDFAAAKAAEARKWFEDHGFKLHLDVLMDRVRV